MLKKSWLIWTLATVITIFSMIWQRRTGPTYPFRGAVTFDSAEYAYRVPRSFDQPSNCPVRLEISDPQVQGTILMKRYGVDEPWNRQPMKRDAEGLLAEIPQQPFAGKIMYYIELAKGSQTQSIGSQADPVIIRFRGAVPMWVVIPHVLLIFLAFLFSTAAGLLALGRPEKMMRPAILGFIFLSIGGFIFGPLMQDYAFGVLWSGFPFGTDLTDNKALIGWLIWLAALALNWKKQRPALIAAAALSLLVVFMIPHSMLGSTLDYSTMKVKTG